MRSKWENKVTREWVKRIRQALQDSIEVDGLVINVGNAYFDDSEVTLKLSLRVKGAETREQRDLKTYAEMDKIDTAKRGEMRGEKYSLIGYRRTAKTRPYIVQNLHNNKEYIFTTAQAQQYFGLEK